MNCDFVTELIPLYYYGELTPVEEDQVDQHVHECTGCARRMERQQTMAAAFDRRQVEPPPLLLDECRAELLASLSTGGAARAVKPPPSKGPWALFLEAMAATFAGAGRLRQPLAAMALILLGYVAARVSGAGGAPMMPANGATDNVYSSVKSVKPGTDGSVQITFDETRRHEISGRLEDPNIQHFLLAGSRDENPAVRVESVGLLKNRADSPQVLDSLLNALETDPNDGVRLRALDALKPVAGEARVTKTLSQVLLTDANPAVRMQVIDMMITRRDDSAVGVLQNLMQREDNSAVRLKARKVLKDWNASLGTF